MLCICVNWTQGSTQHLNWGVVVYSQNRHVWSYVRMYVMASKRHWSPRGNVRPRGTFSVTLTPHRSSLTCMYLHAHWRIPVPLPGSRKPHSDRLIVYNKRGEVLWGWGWGWEGGRTASGIWALTSGACVWYIHRLAPARITSPPRPNPEKPGWVKKGHVFWSSSFSIIL